MDLPIGIASNNHQATIDCLVEQFGLDDVVETHYGCSPTFAGLRRMKPNTYHLQRAIDDPDASNRLYVGDGEVDVEAAAALGVDVAFVRRNHRTGYELSLAPTYELSSRTELRGLSDLAVNASKLY